MPITLNDILEGTSTDQMQSVGQMQVIPIINEGTDDDYFSPPDVTMGTSDYGSVNLENDSDRPTIVPPGAGWVTEENAQNHAIGGGALVPAGQKRHIDTAMCIQASQCGYIETKKHPMLVLPVALRDKALRIKDEHNFSKLWDDISTFNDSYNLSSRGHLEYFLTHFKDELDQFVAEFELVPRQIGAIILVGGRVVGIERAPSQEFWRKIWDPLIRVCYGSMAIKAAMDTQAPPRTRSPLTLGRGAKTLGNLKTALMKAVESQAKLTEKIIRDVNSATVSLQRSPDERMDNNYLTTASTQSLSGQIVARGTSSMNVVYTSLCAKIA